MKHIVSFFIFCLLGAVCHGQTMTLAECIRTGIANNLSVANARIEMDKGKTGVSQSRSRLLPTINGVVQFTDYLKSPVNVTTGVILGNDFPEDPTWQTIKSTQYNTNAGIQLTMPLYNQTIFAAIDVARTVETLNTLSYDKAVEDLTMQIGKIYYMAQASRELVRLTDENIARTEELCGITEALLHGGVVMEVDLNRVRINLQTLKSQRDQHATLHEQQLNLLRFLMDMTPETPLEVTPMPDSIDPQPTACFHHELPEMLIARQQVKLAEKRVSAVKAGYFPSLSLTGYAGGIGYHESLSQFKDNWFGNCFLSVSLRIPIFEANTKRLQISQYRYEARQAANRVDQLHKQLEESYNNALLQLNHNMNMFRTQSECRRQAEDVYNVTEEQYKEGIASMTSLLQDEMQLRTAQAACVQAYCQCNLARLDLLRLSGDLTQLSIK